MIPSSRSPSCAVTEIGSHSWPGDRVSVMSARLSLKTILKPSGDWTQVVDFHQSSMCASDVSGPHLKGCSTKKIPDIATPTRKGYLYWIEDRSAGWRPRDGGSKADHAVGSSKGSREPKRSDYVRQFRSGPSLRHARTVVETHVCCRGWPRLVGVEQDRSLL